MKKVLVFIIKNDKLLLILGSDKDPQFHESFWYVVTGGVENIDKDLYDTVRREVKEETNINLKEIIDLNLIFEYESLGKHCIEYAFVAYAEDTPIMLNEENIKYKWCNLDEFIELIKWYYDKKDLRQILEKYI